MKKKLQNITSKLAAASAVVALLIVWQVVSVLELVPAYTLPSPVKVCQAFISDFPLLMQHSVITLQEAFVGLGVGILFGFMMAVLMDHFKWIYNAFYPLVVITQTVPTVAIAPLLVLWFGYEMLPKVILIVIVTFFPVTVGLLDGFRAADKDAVLLLRAMGANKVQIFRFIKLPGSMSHFFASLRISASYAVVGAVISEWLGGFNGLGVYMTRVRKAFSFDKMFAVIFLVSAISLLLMKGIDLLQKRCMPYQFMNERSGKEE